jgi:LIVCS family branched-chain amino acid:cation transporter
LIYSVIYFALVILVSSIRANCWIPWVISCAAENLALPILAVAAIVWPAGPISDAMEAYIKRGVL